MHSHWATRTGYVLRSQEQLDRQRAVFGSDPRYLGEAEMAEEIRAAGVGAILDLGYTSELPIAEVSVLHDYAFDTQRRFPDAILGHWLHIDPRSGQAGVEELRRCFQIAPGFVGLCVSGATARVSPTDPAWDGLYELSGEAGAPVLMLVGHTGAGAGLPGGAGMILDHCHPRHVDAIAARYPKMTIIAGRPAWPWQAEMISILLHKPNVWYELHGWSPRYFTAELKHEIPRRLRSRVMFGADFPLFTYDRLFDDWVNEGYSEELLADVLYGNASRLLRQLAAAR
ncbi:MAG: hypothetical protein DLM61_10810 [Pseudonocardiales bacterium]|nr:MAG: hypothetical protein DLM61_10810 [Pseudonocardiales bacterium]